MPNPNAIVGRILRIEPNVEGLHPAEAFRRYPDGFNIAFERDQVARLFPGDQAAGLLQILEGLRKLGSPAYVETDPQTRGISRLLIPIVTRIANIVERTGEGMLVELTSSHARHLLPRKNPDYASLLDALRAARNKNAAVIVTETDSHEIIDVRPSPEEPRLTPKVPPGERQPEIKRKKWWCWFFCWFRCVSLKKAEQMFNLVSATTCNPLTASPPCIPFMYPDDGCWARASEMCRLMIAAGLNPRKVWIQGNLLAKTRNNPNCQVGWGWHVAPTLCVRRCLCWTETMVIDPSLFTGPVSESAWKAVQNDPNATLTHTDASDYFWGQTDPTYAQTNIDLQNYRLALQLRATSVGPPPYAYCP